MPGPVTNATDARFTPIDRWMVVAIVAMLGSIAIPVVQGMKAKQLRQAALQDLSVLREDLTRYAAEHDGHYPGWGELHTATLSPLDSSPGLLRNLEGRRLDYYIPWNVFDKAAPADRAARSPGFLLRGTLAGSPSVVFYVTDGSTYNSENGVLKPVDQD